MCTMMQPMDIKSQSFGTGLFGYKKSEVDQYVDTVYRAYDELFTENKKLREEQDKLSRFIEEQRVKLFELENKADGVVSESAAEAEKEKIIAEARKTAADILNAAKTEGDKIAGAAGSAPVDDTIFEDVVTEAAGTEEAKGESKLKMAGGDSATSKFFQQSNEDVFGDGDDVFVGEIEDNRKSNKVMIGDGEEEGADDFEFL